MMHRRNLFYDVKTIPFKKSLFGKSFEFVSDFYAQSEKEVNIFRLEIAILHASLVPFSLFARFLPIASVEHLTH
jgi:hypothetical protein